MGMDLRGCGIWINTVDSGGWQVRLPPNSQQKHFHHSGGKAPRGLCGDPAAAFRGPRRRSGASNCAGFRIWVETCLLAFMSERLTTADLLLASILTSDVRNNKINIELLNILVHSRSKVEVFFWQTLPAPLPSTSLSLLLFTNALCEPIPIHHSVSGGRKSTFPWRVFFSSASAAVSAGTRETSLMDTLVITGRELWDPHTRPLSLLHSPRVFARTFLCPSSVVHSLFDNDDYCTCLNPPLQSGSAFWDPPRSVQGPLRVQARFYCLETNSSPRPCRQREGIVSGVLGQMCAGADSLSHLSSLLYPQLCKKSTFTQINWDLISKMLAHLIHTKEARGGQSLERAGLEGKSRWCVCSQSAPGSSMGR